jgi:hypothetical protein
MLDEYGVYLAAAAAGGLLIAYQTRCCQRRKPTAPTSLPRPGLFERYTFPEDFVGSNTFGRDIRAARSQAHVNAIRNTMKTILPYLDQSKLQTDGILREVGNLNRAQTIAAWCVDNANGLPLPKYDVHEVISALKKVLLDYLPDVQFNWSRIYQEMIACDVKGEPATFLLKAEIQKLIDQHKFGEAAIIHDLLHIGFLVQQQKTMNRMDPTNVGKQLAPSFLTILGQYDQTDPYKAFDMINRLATTLALVVQDNFFAISYDDHVKNSLINARTLRRESPARA